MTAQFILRIITGYFLIGHAANYYPGGWGDHGTRFFERLPSRDGVAPWFGDLMTMLFSSQPDAVGYVLFGGSAVAGVMLLVGFLTRLAAITGALSLAMMLMMLGWGLISANGLSVLLIMCLALIFAQSGMHIGLDGVISHRISGRKTDV